MRRGNIGCEQCRNDIVGRQFVKGSHRQNDFQEDWERDLWVHAKIGEERGGGLGEGEKSVHSPLRKIEERQTARKRRKYSS